MKRLLTGIKQFLLNILHLSRILNEIRLERQRLVGDLKRERDSLERAKRELMSAHTQFTNNLAELQSKMKLIMEVTNVGVDYSPNQRHSGDRSWAVICIQGKPEYVKFVDLGHREVRDIANFIRQFDHKNVRIDGPFGMPRDFFFRY